MMGIFGTGGGEAIVGTAGDDVIDAGYGSDTIDAGPGNDTITDLAGTTNSILGGDGNDFISFGGGLGTHSGGDGTPISANIDAGSGDDTVTLALRYGTSAAVILGAGNDLLIADRLLTAATLSLGTGQDRIVFTATYGAVVASSFPDAVPVVTDFAAGNGGDVLSLGEMLAGLYARPSSQTVLPAANPFASGHLLLVQDGADTVVRLDVDGTGGGNNQFYVRDILRLQNVNAASLTAWNFAGFAPNGSALVSATLTGTAAADILSAGDTGGQIDGLTGNDLLRGGSGNDILNGGTGQDWLIGGYGNDSLSGGTENDRLDGGYGDDTVNGGDGDDVITDPAGNDSLTGGAGNDTIALVREGYGIGNQRRLDNLAIDAGDGNDTVTVLTDGSSVRPITNLVVNLGAGDDYFRRGQLPGSTVLTLGSGKDVVEIEGFGLNNNTAPTVEITDFATGANGDQLNLETFLTRAGWNGTDNPFATGLLRLVQDGADTVVQWDYDGVGGYDPFPLVRLDNVSAAQLTGYNLGGFDPARGANGGIAVVGSGIDDRIFGGAGNDILSGLAGNDWISAGAGDDSVDGGDGNDTIYGGRGKDTLNGGLGDDRIFDQGDAGDTIIGGDGNDYIEILSSTQTSGATVTIDAGAGNDIVDTSKLFAAAATIDLGAGDDRAIMNLPSGDITLTLGSGTDTVVLSLESVYGKATITDFQTGDVGDVLDWTVFLSNYFRSYPMQFMYPEAGADAWNPFRTGQARLVQQGADTLLQVGQTVGTLFTDPQTLFVFKNTTASSFTAHNLGIDPLVTTLGGSDNADTLNGSAGADVSRGGLGDDNLSGNDGNDTLDGGDGNDSVSGGIGDDVMLGGRGNDSMLGGSGNDTFLLGPGMFSASAPDSDLADGGDGNDLFEGVGWSDTVIGGAGDDRAYVSFEFVGTDVPAQISPGTVTMGDGNDVVVLQGGGVPPQSTSFTIDLGAGNDLLIFSDAFGPVTLGSGQDTVRWIGSGLSQQQLVITDFQTGNGGDIVDLDYFAGQDYRGENLFRLGAIKLTQVGADVVLSYNFAGLYGKPPTILFKNTTVGNFTAQNFKGQDPAATPDPNRVKPIEITADYTITHGTTVDVKKFALNDTFGFTYLSPTGTAQFINHGDITVGWDKTTAAHLTGFVASPYVYGITPQAQFLNAADGTFKVRSDQGGVTGFSGQGLTFRNEGLFEAVSTVAINVNDAFFTRVTGVDMAGSGAGSFNAPVINSGTIHVSGGSDTYGVRLGGHVPLNNTGDILVEGNYLVTGVQIREAWTDEVFNNAGSITAISAPSSPYNSVGVLLETYQGPTTLRNSGTITADIAFLVIEGTIGHTERIINSGTINGTVALQRGDDEVVNSGTINGVVLLGPGNDRYDGTGGFLTGDVRGGLGNDTLIGGSGADVLLGDEGDDLIQGAAGDDIVDGGAGSDVLDGGPGWDLASWLGSPEAVTVDLATGIATAGQAIDYLRNFEGAIGSRGADSLSGSGQDDDLYGFDGDDHIDGRLGNDVIMGNHGADVLTGGGGFDTFLFEKGDGADEITDFNFNDGLYVYGYSGYQSLTQQGSDVKMTLSATDSILLRGTTVAQVSTNTFFDINPSGVILPKLQDTSIVVQRTLQVPAGTVLELSDAVLIRSRFGQVQSTAVAMLTDPDLPGVQVWNSGTIRYVTTTGAAAESTGVATFLGNDGTANGYSSDHTLVNLASGVISVETQRSKAVGVRDLARLWNYGTIEATSHAGDASGVTHVHDANYGATDGLLFNAGTITVNAAATGRGVEQQQLVTAAVKLMVNTGAITVHGALASVGIENPLYAGFFANTGPAIVNSGTITVTDETAAIDSAGLRIDLVSKATIWNSGTITADYAILFAPQFSYSPSADYKLSVYNSGQLNGRVQLTNYSDVLVNTGGISGSVNLGGGNDTFDGRLGQLSGALNGFDGDDTLLTGAGDQQIFGGFGNDVLSGGAGSDTLTGDAGADTFRFGSGYGHDTITDFEFGTTGDRIVIEGYSAYQSLVQQGSDVLITFSATDSLLVRGASAASFSSSLFTFSAAPIAAIPIPSAPTAAAAPTQPANFTAEPTVTYPAIIGTAFDDVLTGGIGPDLIQGLAGNDKLDGGVGNDVLQGGAGIDQLLGRDGNDVLDGGSETDTLNGGLGNDTIDGGPNVDTAVFAGPRSAYTLSQTTTGNWTVSGPDGSDTLANVEFAKFDDQTIRLYPGTGTSVNFASDSPAAYMTAIRDFDGNDVGSAGGWRLIGSVDANGDGDVDRIFVNKDNGRFAEVGTAPDGKVYFGDYGWAGETRVVGIYVDPLVASGQVLAGSDTDSQRRFQNDLRIDNIKAVLGAGDFDRNGLQEVYFSLTDGTAYLHAYMHADGNIQYANYQSQQQVIDFLTQNGWSASTYAGWFG